MYTCILAACCGFDLCHKYILYLYLYLYTLELLTSYSNCTACCGFDLCHKYIWTDVEKVEDARPFMEQGSWGRAVPVSLPTLAGGRPPSPDSPPTWRVGPSLGEG